MLSRASRILDFDGSLLLQPELIRKHNPKIIDFKFIGPDCRLWMSKKTSGKISKQFEPADKNAITFLGSGDFHNISYLLVRQFTQPINVIIFDFHPDWDIRLPKFGCGSWVSRVLEMPNVEKIIILGASSDDISSSAIRGGNLKEFFSGRVELYPFRHSPTKISRSQTIQWKELEKENQGDFLAGILGKLKAQQVYVSIDKDCLNSQSALTNWEEGYLSLEYLLSALRLIKNKLDIVGLDITGEYSPEEFASRFKGLISRLDHPKSYSAKNKPQELINSINQKTNLKILEALFS